jgi:hypothetical protein
MSSKQTDPSQTITPLNLDDDRQFDMALINLCRDRSEKPLTAEEVKLLDTMDKRRSRSILINNILKFIYTSLGILSPILVVILVR